MTTLALRNPARALSADGTTLVLRATPLVALVNAPASVLVIIAGALALAVLSDDARLHSPWPWLCTAAAGLAWDLLHWHGLDDHIFLMHYWLLAVGMSRFATDRARALDRAATSLIGLTFLIAVVAKLAWGDVLSGRFYRAMLFLDDRTTWLARLAGISDPDANYALVQRVHTDGMVTLDGGNWSSLVAAALVVGTLAIEGTLAVAYLGPSSSRVLLRLRVPMLVTFCIATYAIIPVAGFGSLLLLMAAAERRLGHRLRVSLLLSPLALLAWAEVWEWLH